MSSVSSEAKALADRSNADSLVRDASRALLKSDKPLHIGSNGEVEIKYDSTAKVLDINSRAGLNAQGLPNRLTLVEFFHRLPKTNATLAITDPTDTPADADTLRDNLVATTIADLRTALTVNRDFEVAGNNASNDDVTHVAGGGVKMETDGADGDEVILQPHADAGMTQWNQSWRPSDQPRFEALIKSGSAITKAIIWAGLKLTNTEVKATDNDQAYVRYEAGVNSGKFEVVESVGGTDKVTDLGVTVAVDTLYRIVIEVLSDRTVKVYINGDLVYTGTTALTAAAALKPFVGVAAEGTTPGAKFIEVKALAASKLFS